MDGERWAVIEGAASYEVSDMGRVRSRAKGWKCGAWRFVKGSPDAAGYLVVSIYTGVRQCKTRKIHQLVAAAFIGPRPTGTCVNHKNGIKDDNRLENLEYVTPSENTHHAIRTGLRKAYGESHYKSKLTAADVVVIRRRLAGGETCAAISKDYNTGPNAISYIKHGKSWRSVPQLMESESCNDTSSTREPTTARSAALSPLAARIASARH